MELTKTHIKFIQQELNKMGLNAGTVDGLVGKNTKEALLKVPGNTNTWTFKRQAIAFIQFVCHENDIDAGKVDGLWGSSTQDAYDQLTILLETGNKPEPWRGNDDAPVPSAPQGPNPNNWPIENTPEFHQFYGQKGESNLVKLVFPYPMRISWDMSKTAKSTRCHKKVKDSLHRVLTNVLDHYGLDEINRLRLNIYDGCYNDRMIRGGNRPSTHSWGIALDFDPDNNSLRWGRDRASFARPEYDKWWEIWESEGWVSLGRKKNYDWMHVQAAR